MENMWTFDIETLGTPLSQEEVERLREEYEPPSNWKNEAVIEKGREAHVAKAATKNKFRWYGNRPICVAFCNVATGATHSRCSDSSEDVVRYFVEFANQQAPNTAFAGHNILKFDLPSLWFWACKVGLSLNQPKRWIDTNDHKLSPLKKMSLKGAARHLGIETLSMDGGDVQGLYDAGNLEAIEHYCIHDCRIQAEVIRKISSFYKLY